MMVKLPVAVLPASSVAEQATVVVPMGKWLPEGGALSKSCENHANRRVKSRHFGGFK
jgi:hypothetical protein